MELTQTQITLRELPTGSRILIRTKKDWRTAVVSRFNEQTVTLIVCSPLGKTYRLHRTPETEILLDGNLPLIKCDTRENWRENFTKYDFRW